MPERLTRRRGAAPPPLHRGDDAALAEAGPLEPRGTGRDPGPGVMTPRQVLALQRTAGNRAINGIVGTRRRADSGPVVQRWAFIAEKQVPPDDKKLDSKMKALAADKLVHNYTSQAEFRNHAAGKTDYLGNLPGPASSGTWVRFDQTGTNLLGENHTHVTLRQVLPAVESTSFISERLSIDDMPAGSKMRAAYEAENQDVFKQFGVAGVKNKRPYGAESLFPKMGYALNLLVPIDTAHLNDLKAGAYLGQPLQRYLKIAWGYSKDVAAQVTQLKKASKKGSKKPPKVLDDLASVHETVKDKLDGFITALPVNGYLGDALDTPAGRKILAPLQQFCVAVIAALLERTSTDPALADKERKDLGSMAKGSQLERDAVFSTWRSLHFSHTVRAAAKRGVRYAGMGKDHLVDLITEGIPANSHAYDMTSTGDLARFEALTKKLASSVKKAP